MKNRPEKSLVFIRDDPLKEEPAARSQLMCVMHIHTMQIRLKLLCSRVPLHADPHYKSMAAALSALTARLTGFSHVGEVKCGGRCSVINKHYNAHSL